MLLRSVLLLFGLGCAAAVWAGTPQPADWGDHMRPLADQRQPPLVPSNPLVAPSSAAPALVVWDELFSLTLEMPPGRSPGSASAWQAVLLTRIRAPFGGLVGAPVLQRYELSIEALEVGERPSLIRLWVRLPARAPRETYHLEVLGPEGLVARRPNAVRVLGSARRLKSPRFAVMGDSQLRDPSTRLQRGHLNNGSFPRRGKSEADRMFLQELDELDFFDPDFVLYLGDLLFGIDYRAEYPETLQRLWSKAPAAFMVPGNHDAMALYELALKEGWWVELLGSVRCALPLARGELSVSKIFTALGCVYGDLRKILFQDLQQDGLDYWRRYLGATDAAVDLGEHWHLIALNSYAGSSERRHGFVLGLGFAGLDLGVAAVDNYGGSLSDAQLSWFDAELKRAEAAGRRVIVALHHDPRGNEDEVWGRRYHANLPFPTEPLGLRRFQEWNYNNPNWALDDEGGRKGERQTENSATAFLSLLSGRVAAVFTGHLHADRDQVVPAGAEIIKGSGLRAREPLRFCRVTSASASPLDDKGYWGYRLIELGEDGELHGLMYHPQRAWASVPAGNLWLDGDGHPDSKGVVYRLNNGLPERVRGRLRLYLPERLEGYDFLLGGSGKLSLDDAGRGPEGMAVYYVRVELEGVDSGPVPPPPGKEVQATLRVRPAKGNRVPVVDFFPRPAQPAPGQSLRFDLSQTRDPEGRPLVSYVWDFGDGHSARGPDPVHRYEQIGRYEVSLTVVDDRGAFARHATALRVVAPAVAGCASAAGSGTSLWFLVGLILGWIGLVGFKNR